MKRIFILILISCTISGYAQISDKEINNHEIFVDFKTFKEQYIKPFIDKNFEAIDGIIHFPLYGEWGFVMELGKPDSLWTRQDFFDNYDKFFSEKIISALDSSYHDLEIYDNSEIIFPLHFKTKMGNDEWDEWGILFRFKKFGNKWKLYVIQHVG